MSFWRLCVWYANFLCLIISFYFSLNLWLKCLKISLRSLWIFSVKLTPYHYWDLHFKPKPTWHSNAAVFVFCSYKYMSMQNTLTICLLDLLISFSYFIPSPRKLLNTSCLPTRMLVLFSKAKKISGGFSNWKVISFPPHLIPRGELCYKMWYNNGVSEGISLERWRER